VLWITALVQMHTTNRAAQHIYARTRSHRSIKNHANTTRRNGNCAISNTKKVLNMVDIVGFTASVDSVSDNSTFVKLLCAVFALSVFPANGVCIARKLEL